MIGGRQRHIVETAGELERYTVEIINIFIETVIDFVIAKNNYDRANSNLIITRYDYLLRTKILDYYRGKALW